MANFFNESIIEEKANAVQSTVDGSRSFTSPATGPTVQKYLHPKCAGCSLASAHSITVATYYNIPDNKHLYEDFPSNVRFVPSELNRLQSALWYLWFYPFGFYSEQELISLSSSGAPNNPTESVQYRVEGVSGSTVTLFGPNPKKISKTILKPNPDYVPGDGPRYIAETVYFALPIGSQLQFLFPSALENKCRPMITEIDYPVSDADEVEFEVTTTHSDLGNYNTTQDPDIEQDEFDCRVLFELQGESKWFNFQSFSTQVFSRRTITLTEWEEFVALPNFSASTNVKVLTPGMIPDAISVEITRTDNPSIAISDYQAVDTLFASGVPTSYVILTPYDFSDLDEITISYWVRDTDAGAPLKLHHQSTCSNDQYDPTTGARRCMSPNCDGFDEYTSGGCWQPSASGFCLGNKAQGFRINNLNLDIADLDSSWFSDWWVRQNYFIKRTSPYTFTLLKNKATDGPSIANLCGSYSPQAPFVGSELEYEDRTGAYGMRVVQGGTHFFLPAWQVQAPYEYVDEEDDTVLVWFDHTDGPIPGSLPDAIGESTFATPDIWGDEKPEILKLLPPRNIGGVSVAKHGAKEPHTMHATDLIMANADATIVDIDMDDVSQPVEVETMALLNSTSGLLDDLDIRGDDVFGV